MQASPARLTMMAAALYLSWVAATYLLEGLPRTLLRPEATALRAAYALVANITVGLGGSAVVLVWLARRHPASAAAAGFGHARRTLVGVLGGAALGGVTYWVQAPPPRPPAALLNAFAQVIPVSAAEVVVCWSVTAAVIARVRPSATARRARLLALGPGAVLFGLYHVAHSPPFSSAAMIALLTGVGIVSGVFYAVSGDVHGTVVFHNFLALFGVLEAMERAGRPAHVTHLQAPLQVMALATLVVMVALHGVVRRARARTTSPG